MIIRSRMKKNDAKENQPTISLRQPSFLLKKTEKLEQLS